LKRKRKERFNPRGVQLAEKPSEKIRAKERTREEEEKMDQSETINGTSGEDGPTDLI